MKLDELVKVLEKDTVIYIYDIEMPYKVYSIREDDCFRIGIADNEFEVLKVSPSYCSADALDVIIRIPDDD